ncbi:MAG: hypothetical protein WAR22_14105 [Desulfomonilia bacterium]
MKVTSLTELIRKNEYFLTRDLVMEIRRNPDFEHYSAIKEEYLYDRVHHVLYHVYKRLPNWLSKGVCKSTIDSIYSEIGRQRHKEGIPVEEVVRVLFFIKRRICRYIAENAPAKFSDLDPPSEFFTRMSVIFERMAGAVFTGYPGRNSPSDGTGDECRA